MKQIFRVYLTFNKRERNGGLVLMSIIFSLLIYLNISSHFYSSEKVDFSIFKKQMQDLNANNFEFQKNDKTSIKIAPTYFLFNPNKLSEKNWTRLGLSEKQIQSIKKYELKGGTFKSKMDLKKMYSLPTEQYLRLEPFIQIEKIKGSNSIVKLQKAISKPIIELNACDSAQLTTIKGIGPFYAKSIIKYRNQLGGFVRKEQLMEIWKFDQEKFDGIQAFVRVDNSLIKTININSCSPEQLKHPYLTWNAANAIVNYRCMHGTFKTIDDIQKTDLVDYETLRKIAAYLILE